MRCLFNAGWNRQCVGVSHERENETIHASDACADTAIYISISCSECGLCSCYANIK